MTKYQYMDIIAKASRPWPKEDKEQIDFVLENFHYISSIIGPQVKDKINLAIQQGPFGQINTEQHFMHAIKFLRKTIEFQYSKENND